MSAKKTILYVDDEEINLYLFERSFENDFDIIPASSGPEALEHIKTNEKNIDVVISDMRMPEMDGLEFIQLAKAQLEIPYYILTGYEFNPELEEALDNNLIKMIFKKPYDSKQIKEVVLKATQ